MPSSISAELSRPFRPRNGIHEIMRMMLEVRNGTVQTRNSTICMVGGADVEGEEIGDREADHQR